MSDTAAPIKVSWVVGIGYVPIVDALALEADGATVYHYWAPKS